MVSLPFLGDVVVTLFSCQGGREGEREIEEEREIHSSSLPLSLRRIKIKSKKILSGLEKEEEEKINSAMLKVSRDLALFVGGDLGEDAQRRLALL